MLSPVPAGQIDVPNPLGKPGSTPLPMWEAPPAARPGGPNVIIIPGPPDLAKARAGDVDAQVRLGISFATAKPPNFAEALKWFSEASNKGSATGAMNVGQMHEIGLGVAKDSTEAVKWFRLAAERGFASAQARLGQHYENGFGVPQNYAEALKWYRAAADQKNAIGQNGLGALYERGRGVPTDQVEATRLFRLAADQGQALAQANLGLQYLAGRGTGQSARAGYFWLNLAAARLPAGTTPLRDQVARARDAAAAKLAPSEVESMQQMAAAWKPGSADVPADLPLGPTVAK
ncbi:MAG: tetratricopeptide repeat protein [Pseudomonadota bacterium]